MSEIKVVRPDILDCLANLSSDEVFTPPTVVNKMLDLLPQELFESPKTKFLDPFTKSGVFLREIVKRLDKGLIDVIPDKETRIRHIFANQVYGIAITQLTALFSRRSLYCNKDVNNERSTVRDCFKTEGGNIGYHPCRHTWVDGSCKVCGASKKALSQSADVENYAYPFLHDEVFMKQAQELGFDVVIGNPPYQMQTNGAENGAQAKPVYNLFVEQAKKLNPKYLSMIIPSRWFTGGWSLDSFRDGMIGDEKLVELHDYPDASECFSGISIKGGVCYFLWGRNHQGCCKFVSHNGDKVSSSVRMLKEDGIEGLIRYNQAVSILHKVRHLGEKSIMSIVSSQKPYGLGTAYRGHEAPFSGAVMVYQNKGVGYIKESDIPKKDSTISKYKVYISAAYGAGDDFPHQILNKPILGEKNSCCTETYITIGGFNTESEARNLISYIQTRLFRFMVMLLKNSQHALKKVYALVPMQDFSRPWTDAELYTKYGITSDEQKFIESMIRPMDAEAKK